MIWARAILLFLTPGALQVHLCCGRSVYIVESIDAVSLCLGDDACL